MVINVGDEFESIKMMSMSEYLEKMYVDVTQSLLFDDDKIAYEALWAFNELPTIQKTY